jgi:hypothetical protein
MKKGEEKREKGREQGIRSLLQGSWRRIKRFSDRFIDPLYSR